MEKSHPSRPLPFPAWVDQTYPEKTATREFLRMIGALDVAYLMYFMKNQRMQKNQKIQRTQRNETIDMKKKAETPVITAPTTPIKKEKKKTIVKKVKETKTEPELTIEFEHKPEPMKESTVDQTPATPIEPEPLILQEEPISPLPTSVRAGGRGAGREAKNKWIDSAALEEVDLRKSGTELKTGDVTVSFDVRPINDEEETVIMVNGVSWRALLTSPALNVSQMTQIVRVSYGELYVLGRMALGAMSGEGYMAADEVKRIADLLKTAEKTVLIDVLYFEKNKTSKVRTAKNITIRFERLS